MKTGLEVHDLPPITAFWRRHSAQAVPFFAYSAEVRKMIYTTNAIKSVNAKLRRSVRSRGHFPSDETAMKIELAAIA